MTKTEAIKDLLRLTFSFKPKKAKNIVSFVKDKVTHSQKKELSITDIHSDFYSLSYRLQQKDVKRHDKEFEFENIEKEAEYYRDLNMVKHPAISKYNKIRSEMADIREENRKLLLNRTIVNSTEHRFPMFRVIDRETILSVIKKYGLIWGGMDKFIGDVPLRNRGDIKTYLDKFEASIIKQESSQDYYIATPKGISTKTKYSMGISSEILKRSFHPSWNGSECYEPNISPEGLDCQIEDSIWSMCNSRDKVIHEISIWKDKPYGHTNVFGKTSVFGIRVSENIVIQPIVDMEAISVAANKEMFDIDKDYSINEENILINKKVQAEWEKEQQRLKDPIILAPINVYVVEDEVFEPILNNYYFVVTAWGDEASDENIHNQVFN